MCGIAGWTGPRLDADIAATMLAALAHRGPDDSGVWREDAVWLGQRRLAIVDLTPTGHQPMLSASGRYVLTYNGEVYNHPELRAELERAGHAFRGHSDTEVMLAAFEAWGVEAALQRFNGMFAFAVWDSRERCLLLARDRIGEKPLYYAASGGDLAFASELTALWPLPWLDKSVDREALAAYFRYLCVPAPASIIRGAKKLQPGMLYRWKDGAGSMQPYWSVSAAVAGGRAAPLALDFNAAADELESLLRDAVRIRLRSDVPYGALLSGGIDSSVVVALMQQEASRPVSTYTVGFEQKSHDESAHAQAVADHLGTMHTMQTLLPRDVIELATHVATLHDEPFADSSSIPTFLLSRFTRSHVKVALTGDGGDELFGGYPRYFWASRIERLRRRLTPAGATMLAGALQCVPAGAWNGVDRLLLNGRFGGANGLGSRAHRFADYLRHPPEEVYRAIVSAWKQPTQIISGDCRENPAYDPDLQRYSELDWAAAMMATDQQNYLPNDILVKADRTSMAVALETRAPLLDHRLVEWSWRLPLRFKLDDRGDAGKLILREVLYRHVPRALIDRPKMGFGMPVGTWLRGPLRAWAEDLLGAERLSAAGLDAQPVLRAWREHLAGAERMPEIWTVLMWVQWQEKWRATL
jgi:asparagine synthase (glutamine-hydrolysing)